MREHALSGPARTERTLAAATLASGAAALRHVAKLPASALSAFDADRPAIQRMPESAFLRRACAMADIVPERDAPIGDARIGSTRPIDAVRQIGRASTTLLAALLLPACLVAGVLGPWIGNAWEAAFAPAWSIGDFDALYRDSGRRVVIFTASTCPHCKRLEAFLDHAHVAYADFVVDRSADAMARFRALGGTAVPLAFIGKRRIVGYREDVIRDSLALVRNPQ